MIRKSALILFACFCLRAADFALEIGNPYAAIGIANEKDRVMKTKNALVALRVVNCSDPAKAQVTATAEGIVDGSRRSVPLPVTPGSAAGSYVVPRDWDQAGIWVVSVSGVCSMAKAGAIIPVQSGNFVRESSKFFPHAPTAAEVDASLKTLGGKK